MVFNPNGRDKNGILYRFCRRVNALLTGLFAYLSNSYPILSADVSFFTTFHNS